MGFLKTNYDDVNTGFDPLPVGKYECIVSEVKVTQSSTNKPMIKVTLTVRDDVEQAGQKRKFFDNLLEQENMMWKFQQVAKAAQLPAGMDFETLADFAAAILYRPVVIKNKHEPYNGEIQDKVHRWGESKLDAGDFEIPSGNDGSPDITDDDLPF